MVPSADSAFDRSFAEFESKHLSVAFAVAAVAAAVVAGSSGQDHPYAENSLPFLERVWQRHVPTARTFD